MTTVSDISSNLKKKAEGSAKVVGISETDGMLTFILRKAQELENLGFTLDTGLLVAALENLKAFSAKLWDEIQSDIDSINE
jgi:hypothetical protein